MREPIISVIMPVYNGEKYLNEAIDSILNQTYTNFEFIILNDGSTDKTEEIILSYDDPRIVYVKNEKNIQIVKTLNKGIALAKGEYIARMDADDINLPERFEKQVEILEEAKDDRVIFSTVTLINYAGNEIPFWNEDRESITSSEILKKLPKRNCLAHPTLMVKKNLLLRYQYDEHSEFSEDYNLWLRMANDGHVFYKISLPLLKYRVHKDSISKSSGSQLALSKKRILAKYYFIKDSFRNFRFYRIFVEVLASMPKDIIEMLKIIIANPLRAILKYFGKIVYYIFPEKLEGIQILFMFPTYQMGGADHVHMKIVKAVSRFNGLTLFTRRSTNSFYLQKFKNYSKVKDISMLTNRVIGQWFTLGYIEEMIKRSNVNIVFSYNNMIAVELSKTFGESHIAFLDIVHAINGYIEHDTLPAVPYLKKRIVIDKYTKRMLINNYSVHNLDMYADRIKLIDNYADDFFGKKTMNGLFAVYIGRDSGEKRIDIIEKTAQKIHDLGVDMHTTFVGVAKENYEKYVTYVGMDNEPDKYYKKSNILLLASWREGFPLVVMEAMAHGVVPICTNVGGISTHIANGVNGFLVDGKNEETIVNNFVEILKYLSINKEMLKKMSKTSYEYAKNNFGAERFTKQYNELFDEYIKEEVNV